MGRGEEGIGRDGDRQGTKEGEKCVYACQACLLSESSAHSRHGL